MQKLFTALRLSRRASFALILTAVVVVGGLSAGTARGAAFTDDFNRPPSTDLGPNWVENVGSWIIRSDGVLIGNAPARSAVTTVTGFDSMSPVVSLDATYPSQAPPDVAAVAAIARYADDNNSVYVKVQNTGVANKSAFDSLFFYYGTDGGAWSGMTGGGAQVTITPASTLRLTVSVVGSDVTAMIDTNFDGTPEFTYTRGGLPTENLGTKVGVGLLLLDTAVWADNFNATEVPEPTCVVALGAGGMLLVRRRVGLRQPR